MIADHSSFLIFVFHSIEHLRALEGGLVAECYIGILIGDFQQSHANGPTLDFAQLRKFLDDFRCAHPETIAVVDNLSGERFGEQLGHVFWPEIR